MAKDNKILIVEDDDELRSLYTLLLNNKGYETVAVASAEEALKQLTKEHFSILLTDCCLPGIYGDQLIEKIRENGERIKTILMSNLLDVKDHAEKCHADGCFCKDDFFQLFELIKKLLENHAQPRKRRLAVA